jgi:hypothetical protein
MVAYSKGISQTQSASLRIYVKEFMTGFGAERCHRVGRGQRTNGLKKKMGT